MSSSETAPSVSGNPTPTLRPDARGLVRLIQCPVCSRPLRIPVTVPCGQSLCRDCLPPPHARENISYPNIPGRQQGILCPLQACQKVHALEECSIDVVLAKVMEIISTEVARYRSVSETLPLVRVNEILGDVHQRNVANGLEKRPIEPHSKQFNGSRLVATFSMAEMGELRYSSDASYDPETNESDAADTAFLEELKEASQEAVECHVCYSLLLDPTTTPCGHTFCRNCLRQILSHSSQCAVCRRLLSMPTPLQRQPSNARLGALLSSLCPDTVAARAAAAAEEERESTDRFETPLFVCALSFPSIPTFLHIFEPRYRLMIRRAQEGNGTFGMLGYNSRGTVQGRLGRTPFFEYGTILKIENIQYFEDGRSFILTKGISRFRILEHGTLDGYTVGHVEKVEDISLAEQEQEEAAETTRPAESSSDPIAQLDRLPTAELLQICTDFVERAQSASAPWLHQNILDVFGEPPSDPAVFAYWFASVLPIREEEKVSLLATTSVRQRLKIASRWIRRIEAQRW